MSIGGAFQSGKAQPRPKALGKRLGVKHWSEQASVTTEFIGSNSVLALSECYDYGDLLLG